MFYDVPDVLPIKLKQGAHRLEMSEEIKDASKLLPQDDLESGRSFT